MEAVRRTKDQTKDLENLLLHPKYTWQIYTLFNFFFKLSSSRRNIVLYPLYVESKKKWYKLTYLQNWKRLKDSEEGLVATSGEGPVRKFGMDMNILLHLKWITNKDLRHSTGNSAQCYAAAWMGGEFGREWYVHMYGWVPSLSTWNCHNIVNQNEKF